MDLLHLQTFSEVARTGSFTRAAARLGYVQSTVSGHVRRLEEELGVRLFDRLGRAIRLTAAGEALREEAADLLDRAEAAARAARLAGDGGAAVTGRVTLAAPESLITYRLPELISRFHRDFPGVELAITPVLTGRLRGPVEQSLVDGRVDVAFLMDEPAAGSSRLATEVLWDEPITVIAPPDHPLTRGAATPDTLTGVPILLPEAPGSGCAYRTQFTEQLRAAVGPARETLEFASVEAVKQCVVAGLGISALPSVAVESELRLGRLARVSWGEFQIETRLAWNPKRWQSPAVRAFIAQAREFAAGGGAPGGEAPIPPASRDSAQRAAKAGAT